ncbi:hypothetical protein [Burkholderia stagnalis]|uniref:hypothetical protein n=1 Tax=Burkholderia stagnalis TaxID=1503054 RepID=UPI000F566DE0|nr:hypothetical protein [Burkholderia stagnalis]
MSKRGLPPFETARTAVAVVVRAREEAAPDILPALVGKTVDHGGDDCVCFRARKLEGTPVMEKDVRRVNGRREKVLSAVWRKKSACVQISLFRFDFRLF